MMFYLHGGLPKTGSSAIQAALYEHRAVVQRAGLRYWDFSPEHAKPLKIMFDAHKDVRKKAKLDGRSADFGGAATIHRSLMNFFAQDGDCLISGEALNTLESGKLEKLASLSERPTKVIVYVRDPRSWYTSGVQQRIKTGSQLKGAVATRRNYRDLLQPFLDVFGSEVDIRLYRSSPDGKALIQDFLSAVALDPHLLDDHLTPIVNESLSNDAVWFLEAVTARGRELGWTGVNVPVRKHVEGFGGGKFRLPGTIMDALLAEKAADIAWISDLIGVDLLAVQDVPAADERLTFDPAIIDVVCRLSHAVQEALVTAKISEAELVASQGDQAEAARLIRRALVIMPEDERLPTLRDQYVAAMAKQAPSTGGKERKRRGKGGKTRQQPRTETLKDADDGRAVASR